MAEQSTPVIIPHDQVIDFLLGAVGHMIDINPSRSLVFELADSKFDASRKLLAEISLDDEVTFSLVNQAPQ